VLPHALADVGRNDSAPPVGNPHHERLVVVEQLQHFCVRQQGVGVVVEPEPLDLVYELVVLVEGRRQRAGPSLAAGG